MIDPVQPDAAGHDDVRADSAKRSIEHDWWTIWQSEIAAISQDREMAEFWAATIGSWAGLACAAQSVDNLHDLGRAGTETAAATRPATASAASDPGVHAIAALARRITELEARLAMLEAR
jgi:hypothetical protein